MLRAFETPARLNAAPDGANLIGVPKVVVLENPPGVGEVTAVGNPSSTGMVIVVSIWRSPGVGLWASKIPPWASDNPRVYSAI